VTGRLTALVAILVGPAFAGAATAQAVGTAAPPLPGGAAWQPVSFQVGGASPVLAATLGPQPGLPIGAYVAWIDHTRTELALYPGLVEPQGAVRRGTGAVPSGERWRLLATFNGGFKTRAGAGGFLVNGHVLAPLQTGLGTVVEYRDGSVAILNWQGRTRPAALVLARQNLGPLVWAGRPSAATASPWLWGATLGGGASVWRTALGVTARGDLVYAAADRQTPASLANLMTQIGAVRAIELDINPQWPTFIAYARRGGRNPTKVVPNPQQSAFRYLTPDTRDFFAVYTRAGGGPFVPFR
jgi:hypothetical protein